MNKKELAIRLSKLKPLKKLDISLEQYQTESELAAEILWLTYLNNDIKDKIAADLGCGNGIFGFGSLLLEADKVYFVDKDKEALSVAKENCKSKKSGFMNIDISEFKKKTDTVFMNPPFGVQKRKADKEFLLTAMKNASVIYSIHKIESKKFIDALCKENNFKVENILEADFLLKKTYKFHKKEKYYVKTGVWIIRRL